ncbi:MAG TPA: hypothetical protein VFS08_13330 [Gemmatimonadaceae bacterium]|nr:hypothetical protein [Gemmatimonadaceae bacterium]
MSEVEPARTTLILVRDVLGAGLMGVLVEAEGARAVYPMTGEPGDAAVRRLRPTIVLVDASHAAARTDAFYDAARDCACHVVLFAPTAPWGVVADRARGRPGVTLVVPRDDESLAALLQAALRDAG